MGSGKTTFLKRFAQIVDRDIVDRFTVWLHIDFLTFGNIDSTVVEQELRTYVYRQIRSSLEARFQDLLSSSGDQIRALFEDEIEQANKTSLYGLSHDSPEWLAGVNKVVADCFRNDELYSYAALRVLRRKGRRVVVIFDNTDQMGETFQEHIFLFAQRLSADYRALCIVVLREEKFFAAYRRGLFDAFGDRRFHIGSPDLKRVIYKRLEYGRKKFATLAGSDLSMGLSTDDLKRIDTLLRGFITSTAERNLNIVRMLASVSNGDMRHALDMFRDFISSGNTNAEKIIDIVSRSKRYAVPFHEFAKSAILGSRKYYRSSVARVVNAFKQSDAHGASHMTACRILARMAVAEGAASAHGEGFVAVHTLLREYRSSFGYADDYLQWMGELLRRSLVESEPPRVIDVRQADAVRITAAGAYYWRYLVRSFAYVDLVLVDTPIADHALAMQLAEMAESTDMSVRFRRVRAFMDYLKEKEGEELARWAERSGPYQASHADEICRQIEVEIEGIAAKFHI